MDLRARRPDDVAALETILSETRRIDGYPPHWSANGEFFSSHGELDALVALEGDQAPIAHVALRGRSARSVMELATQATGVDGDQLAVVARLFVSATARRRGVGLALLDWATRRSHELDRRPILDVWEGLRDARDLYEAAGWQVAGAVKIEFRSGCTAECSHEGSSINSLVLLGPPL